MARESLSLMHCTSLPLFQRNENISIQTRKYSPTAYFNAGRAAGHLKV
jgi:hypothetical protein